MTLLTFVIPIRHQDNARDWSLLKRNLSQTVQSISNQSCSDWEGIVVANHGADLPNLPMNFRVVNVDFSPNLLHDKESASQEDFLDAFRLDKGRRVLSGMLDAKSSEFFMIVDDDDLVSSGIVQYVSENKSSVGWKIETGYLWDSGSRFLLKKSDFNGVCGTSLIVSAAAYSLPSSFYEASEEWIKDTLGSHRRIGDMLAERGTPLKHLPFCGAIYRVRNPGSHSQTPSIFIKYFLSLSALKRPGKLLKNILNIRFLSDVISREFFGRAK